MQRPSDALEVARRALAGEAALHVRQASPLAVVNAALHLSSASPDQYISVLAHGREAAANCDPALLAWGVAALIDHAARRSAKDGHIRIDVDYHSYSVGIRVSDEGPYFTRAALETVVADFARRLAADPEGCATADAALDCDIYLAHAVAGAHGGRLSVQEDDGSMAVVLEIPLVRAEATPGTTAPDTRRHRSAG